MSRRDLLPDVWRSEKGLSVLLAFLVLTLFVGAPLVATAAVGPFLFEILFSLLLVSGVVAVSHRLVVTIAVSGLALLALAVRWLMYVRSDASLAVWESALSAAAMAVLTTLVLIQVFRAGPVTGYRIQGAIAAFLLLGLFWTSLYEALYRTVPGAFRFPEELAGSPRLTHSLAYFSFVTLTTVGYGDITPVHPLARSLAIAEALVGQLYPAILIGRLVSMELQSRRLQ